MPLDFYNLVNMPLADLSLWRLYEWNTLYSEQPSRKNWFWEYYSDCRSSFIFSTNDIEDSGPERQSMTCNTGSEIRSTLPPIQRVEPNYNKVDVTIFYHIFQ